MCGIAGIYHPRGAPLDLRLLEAMTQVQGHRGPDGEGYVLLALDGRGKPIAVSGSLSASLRSIDPAYRVGLGHRRLAILDRSPLGHQPMSSADARVWITYNGEVYNYLELRRELQHRGYEFRSMTDTEVVLQAYQEWGTECLSRLNGMFSFAIWDSSMGRLFCARDRFGMKPFYYRLTPDGIQFGSEIKALLQDPSLQRSPNPRMVHDFLVFGLQDHTEETFFEEIQQLLPGHLMLAGEEGIEIRKWWDLPQEAEPVYGNDWQAIETFRLLFEDAIRLHLRSDVAVGSCLSGGLDSSSIVCVIRRLFPSQELKTFSSCFEEPDCDERPYLRAVVALAGTDSTEVFPDGRRLFNEMPRVLWHQEEPFGGTSYLAQWAVMRTAAEHGVRVLLDGQGGDELLCGYPGYWGSYFADLVRRWAVAPLLRESWLYARSQGKLHPTVYSSFARALLPMNMIACAHAWLKRHDSWLHPEFAQRYRDRAEYLAYDARSSAALQNHVTSYLKTHSLPALLHHEDRNSMAFSVEARLPFLDSRLVDFLLRLPPRLKLANGRSKIVLRNALANVLPATVRDRTDKMGFVTPQDKWLRKTLRPDLERLFNTHAFEHRGYWDPVRLRSAYRDYCEGREQIGSSVWRWVSLELWHQRFFM